MRRIYDGQLRKEVGTSDPPLVWTGRITFAVAATPDVDRHYSIFQSLGERFLMVRWHRPGGDSAAEQAALQAMNQDLPKLQQAMKFAVSQLFAGFSNQPVTMRQGFQKRIAALAEFVVRARTHVPRDSSQSKHLHYMPEPEASTRLAQQLCQLGKGSARLSGRRRVSEADLRLVYRVGFDCIPVPCGGRCSANVFTARTRRLAFRGQHSPTADRTCNCLASWTAEGTCRCVPKLFFSERDIHQVSPLNEFKKTGHAGWGTFGEQGPGIGQGASPRRKSCIEPGSGGAPRESEVLRQLQHYSAVMGGVLEFTGSTDFSRTSTT